MNVRERHRTKSMCNGQDGSRSIYFVRVDWPVQSNYHERGGMKYGDG